MLEFGTKFIKIPRLYTHLIKQILKLIMIAVVFLGFGYVFRPLIIDPLHLS